MPVVPYDKNSAAEQCKPKGRKPKYEGQIITERWKPPTRWKRDRFGVMSIFAGANRAERRRLESTDRRADRRKFRLAIRKAKTAKANPKPEHYED